MFKEAGMYNEYNEIEEFFGTVDNCKAVVWQFGRWLYVATCDNGHTKLTRVFGHGSVTILHKCGEVMDENGRLMGCDEIAAHLI